MIELKELTLGYGQRTLLKTVNARITGGQLVALLGRNGTGKSTLLRTIMGLESPQSGEINLQGKDIASLKPEKLALSISFVTTDKVRIANLRCKDVVALGRAPYTNWLGQLQPEDQKIVDNAIQLVGMSGYAEKTMDKMSDGECQRIMIARALAQDTPVILLDEPTAFLDLPNRYELCLLLKKLAQKEGKCILFSTHDLDIALSLCDSIMLIDNPYMYTLPTSEMITSGHIERLFRNESVTFDAQEEGAHQISIVSNFSLYQNNCYLCSYKQNINRKWLQEPNCFTIQDIKIGTFVLYTKQNNRKKQQLIYKRLKP